MVVGEVVNDARSNVDEEPKLVLELGLQGGHGMSAQPPSILHRDQHRDRDAPDHLMQGAQRGPSALTTIAINVDGA